MFALTQLQGLYRAARRDRSRHPTSDLYLIADNLSSHNSLETRTWMEAHPRLHHVFISTGACWLNMQEGSCTALPTRCLRGTKLCEPQGD